MNLLLALGVVVAMLACLVAIPLGLPGLWFMVLLIVALALFGHLSWGFALTAALVALVVEVAEFFIVKKFGAAYGGSKRAFWGAVLGGMAGLFVGIPVPILGPIITAFAGTFLGAFAVTWYETRSLEQSRRVGWGVLLARVVAVALKVGVGMALLVTVAVGVVL